MPGFNSVSPQQLSRLIGTPQCPVILDARDDDDFAADPFLVPSARRIRAQDAATLATAIAPRPAVVLCQKGRKLSEGVAAHLRCAGVAAESLEGGWLAWREAALPAIPAAALPVPGHGTVWVTRHRPKIDRIACPWLIRRFLDPEARFLYVAPADVMDVADRFRATPFDIEGVTFSHRGELCSFDALIDDFGLRSGALDRLATVVRGADTDRHDLAPQSSGLLALSVGMSRLYRNDIEQLEAGIALYDAFYRWARDGFDEGHDWLAGRQA